MPPHINTATGSLLALTALLAASLAGACGTTIIVQVLPGEGGAATSSATAGGVDVTTTMESSNGTDVGMTVQTVGQTGPVFDACTTACGAAAECGMPASFEQCLAACQGVNPQCAPSHQTWLQCLAATGTFDKPACPGDFACSQALLGYILCTGGCAGGSCSESRAAPCACSSSCGGSTFDTACFPDAQGMATCECRENGKYIGKCYGPTEKKFCDVMHSCCAEVFFIDG